MFYIHSVSFVVSNALYTHDIYQMLALILKKGALVNVQDDQGDTVLK